MTLKRDSSKSGKWDIYKNGTTVVNGGSNKISIAKNKPTQAALPALEPKKEENVWDWDELERCASQAAR